MGHSNHSIERFVELLKGAEIEQIVDVRSQPFSKYTPHFNSAPLELSLTRAGIAYIFMGDSLGGRPPEVSMYDQEGHVLYGEMAKSERLREGILTLTTVSSTKRTAMMCSEESPLDCHRRLLITRVLSEGIEVVHLRSDGSQIKDSDFAAMSDALEQPTLFAVEEVKQWRSIRPVLRSTGPDAFSGH